MSVPPQDQDQDRGKDPGPGTENVQAGKPAPQFRMPLRHWLQLALTRGIRPILTPPPPPCPPPPPPRGTAPTLPRRLVDAAGGAEAACGISPSALRSVEGIGRARADAVHASLRSAASEATAELDRAAARGASLLCP